MLTTLHAVTVSLVLAMVPAPKGAAERVIESADGFRLVVVVFASPSGGRSYRLVGYSVRDREKRESRLPVFEPKTNGVGSPALGR